MNGTTDIKIEDHHNHEKDNIKVIRDFEIFGRRFPHNVWVLISKNYAE